MSIILKYIYLLCCVAQPIARRVALTCLLDLGPRPCRLPCRRLPGRPHPSMDTFSRHPAYCKVSKERHLSRMRAENLKTSPTTGWLATTGPNPPCTCVAQMSHAPR